jgi:hypothetical protein
LPLAADESTEVNESTELNPPSQSPLATDESTEANKSIHGLVNHWPKT